MVICSPIPLAPLAPLKHMYLLKALTWGRPPSRSGQALEGISAAARPKKNAKRVQRVA